MEVENGPLKRVPLAGRRREFNFTSFLTALRSTHHGNAGILGAYLRLNKTLAKIEEWSRKWYRKCATSTTSKGKTIQLKEYKYPKRFESTSLDHYLQLAAA